MILGRVFRVWDFPDLPDLPDLPDGVFPGFNRIFVNTENSQNGTSGTGCEESVFADAMDCVLELELDEEDLSEFKKLENRTNNLKPNLLCGNKDFMISQPLGEYIKLKSILQDPSQVNTPFIIQNTLKTLSTKVMDWDMCNHSKKIYLEPNAGGKSLHSEAISVRVLSELFDVTNIATEMEVEYRWFNYKRCDYICTMYDQRVGVSVTRAMAYPHPTLFTYGDAKRLIDRKIYGLLVAREGVLETYDFKKCILHVWCETERISDLVRYYYSTLSDETKDNITLILTVTEHKDASFIYYDYEAKDLVTKITAL